TVRLHVGQDDAGVLRQFQTGRQTGRDVLRRYANLTAMDVTILSQLIVHVLDDVTRNSEADTLAAARLREDQGIDTDHPAGIVDQRSAAVARVDGRVGLDIDDGVVRFQLARYRAHDAHADRSFQAKGRTDRQHQLALA